MIDELIEIIELAVEIISNETFIKVAPIVGLAVAAVGILVISLFI